MADLLLFPFQAMQAAGYAAENAGPAASAASEQVRLLLSRTYNVNSQHVTDILWVCRPRTQPSIPKTRPCPWRLQQLEQPRKM